MFTEFDVEDLIDDGEARDNTGEPHTIDLTDQFAEVMGIMTCVRMSLYG